MIKNYLWLEAGQKESPVVNSDNMKHLDNKLDQPTVWLNSSLVWSHSLPMCVTLIQHLPGHSQLSSWNETVHPSNTNVTNCSHPIKLVFNVIEILSIYFFNWIYYCTFYLSTWDLTERIPRRLTIPLFFLEYSLLEAGCMKLQTYLHVHHIKLMDTSVGNFFCYNHSVGVWNSSTPLKKGKTTYHLKQFSRLANQTLHVW